MRRSSLPHQQRGVIMLMFMLVIVVTGLTLFFGTSSTRALESQTREETGYQLNQAKQALLAYAFNYMDFENEGDNDSYVNDEGPGRLPCPDTNNNGTANADCNTGDRGRLPETGPILVSGTDYHFNDHYTGIDQQFWYVIDDKFSENTENPLNTQDSGSFTIDGQGSYVAVIIAPGPALAAQDRAAGPTTTANYLESSNVAGSNFVNANPADPDNFNDRVIGITTEEIKTLMAQRVAWEVQSFANFLGYTLSSLYFLIMGFLSGLGGHEMQWYAEDDWNLIATFTPIPNASISFAGCDIVFTYTATGIEQDRQTC